MRRWVSASSGGMLDMARRSFAEASSMRSTALSGKERYGTYCLLRRTAAISAESSISTLWWPS